MSRRRSRHNQPAQAGARTAKAGELIRRVIARELEEIEDERLELVSLTGVDVDRDLHRAIVWFTTFDRDDDPEIAEAFDEHRGHLRHEVSIHTTLRRAPELEFRPDTSLRSAERIEQILRENADRPPVPDAEPGEETPDGDA